MLLFPSALCRDGLRGPSRGKLGGGAGPPRRGVCVPVPGVPAEGLRGGARAGIAPGMSAASSAPLASGVAGDPHRGQRGEKGHTAAGARRPAKSYVGAGEGQFPAPRPFAANLRATPEGHSCRWGLPSSPASEQSQPAPALLSGRARTASLI